MWVRMCMQVRTGVLRVPVQILVGGLVYMCSPQGGFSSAPAWHIRGRGPVAGASRLGWQTRPRGAGICNADEVLHILNTAPGGRPGGQGCVCGPLRGTHMEHNRRRGRCQGDARKAALAWSPQGGARATAFGAPRQEGARAIALGAPRQGGAPGSMPGRRLFAVPRGAYGTQTNLGVADVTVLDQSARSWAELVPLRSRV